jgi:DNA polymerase-3 subunit alpha
MPNFAVLHAHTEFSVRDSLIRAEELPQIAAEVGWKACAITDHGGIEGIPRFVKSCRKVGIKPIVGCEIYVACPDAKNYTTERFDKLHHLTILAKNARGFSSLMGLLSYAHRHHYDGRRRNAAVPIGVIIEKLNDCVVLSGCFSSPFWRGSESAAEDLAVFAGHFGKDFFLEVQALWDWNEQVKLNKTIFEVSEALKVPLVLTPDCHFGHAHEQNFHEALLAVASREHLGSPKAWRFSTKQSHLGSPEELAGGLMRAGIPDDSAIQALLNTERVSDLIEDWSWDDLPKPEFPTIEGDLAEVAVAGLMTKGRDSDPVYQERLFKELSAFSHKGLDRYLLLVRHCVNLFKSKGAEIGPRGSVGGSLVAYCLGITPLDPIIHGLTFERFYAPGRTNYPDADLDLSKDFRLKAPEILRQEFGDDNVAQISNYMTFGMRMAVKDAAKAYGIKIEDDSKAFDDPKKDDLKDIADIAPGAELISKSPDAAAFARKLYKKVRQFGSHAGGFIISTTPLLSGRSCVVMRGKDRALCWDMKESEELGFIKLDFLGLDSLSAIEAIQETAHINLNDVTLDDEQIYKDIGDGRTAGVPQFLTPGLRTFVGRLKPKSFDDLVWANAAFRPGGLGQMNPAEMIQRYREEPETLIVYQEQVMELCVDIAGFSWFEADKVRKVMSKSKGVAELEKWRTQFVDGCQTTSQWGPDEANAFWTSLLEWGRYGFNKSHSTSYSWNSYRIAWAKRHYPAPTFAALLNSKDKETDVEGILDEAPEYGVKILPAHANNSDLDWKEEGGKIREPLTVMQNADLRIGKAILKRRGAGGPFKNEAEFVKRMKGIKMPPSILKTPFPESSARHQFELPLRTRALLPKEFRERVKSCGACALRVNCKSPVPPEINKTNVLVVGEAPGISEDKRGRPFVGKTGDLIMSTLMEHGIQRENVSWTNATHCFPNYAKDYDEKVCTWVIDEIALLRPPLILAVGRKSWHKLGGTGSITKANGMVKDIKGSKVVASIHPAAVLRDWNLMSELDRSIRKFASLYRMLVPRKPIPVSR